MQERDKEKQAETLNRFLTELFDKEMLNKFQDIEVTDDNRLLYFKLWCGGVSAGMELDVAIANIKELDNAG